MKVLPVLVLGTLVFASGDLASTTTSTPTPTPWLWDDFSAGWRFSWLTFLSRTRKALRDAIEAQGPTVPANLDWGGSRFRRWGGRLGSWFFDEVGKVHLFFNTSIPGAAKRALVLSGLGLAKAGGVDVTDLVAQHAAAAAAPVRATRKPPTNMVDWHVRFAPFLLAFSFLAGLAGGCVGLPRLRHWCACTLLCRGRRAELPMSRRASVATISVPTLALALVCAPAAQAASIPAGLAVGVAVLPLSSADHLYSSRACWQGEIGLMFGNCCNESDVIWCTKWLCWTAPGCAICTQEVGCWTSLGGGVSLYPSAHSGQARRWSMDLFGVMGWGSVLAEGLGLGELYSLGLVVGVLALGSTTVPNLACNFTCAQAGTTWWYQTAPTVATILDFLRTLPDAVWNFLEAMPLIFGSLLLFFLACGRWVQVLLLLVSVPGALAQLSSSCDGEGEGGAVVPCGPQHFATNHTICDCPFGLIVRLFDPVKYPELNFSATCPETFNRSDLYWTCGWGSWWWQHSNVERPYSHPYMPPDPFSAICYVTTNRSSLYNKTLFVHRTEDGVSLTTLGDGPISTCMLDRRPKFCGDCFGGCFYHDGQHNRGFGVCGGGVRDGPWWFVPLATIRGLPENTWYRPSRALGELLAGKYSVGFGCGATAGLINCWWCNVSFTYTGDYPIPSTTWWPLPGQPHRLCINPQFARRHLPPPPNWLGAIQAVADVLAGKGKCVFNEGWYPVCAHGAWYPSDGGFVVMAGDSQLFGGGPTILKGFLGLYVALVVYMASSGARVVPALAVLLGLAVWSSAECYVGCEAAWCNHYFCVSASPCYVYVGGSLCVPEGGPTLWCASGATLPRAAIRALLPSYVAWVGGEALGWPHGASAWFSWQALKPVSWTSNQTIVCGKPGAEPSISFGLLYFFFFCFIPVLPDEWRAWFAGLCGVLLGLRVRAHYPYRWLLLALQLACGSASSILFVLGVGWWVYTVAWPGAEAALARGVVAGPALGWALRLPTWPEVALACVCVVLYMRLVGRARLAALAAYKISRGLGGFLLLALLLSRGPDRGVLGAELCFPLFESNFDVDTAWWYTSGVFSFAVFLMSLYTPLGRRAKLRVYAKWCRLYCWVETRLSVSPVGVHFPYRGYVGLAWLLGGACFPREASWVCVVLVLGCLSFDLLDWLLEQLLVAAPRADLVVALANTCHAWLCDDDLRAFLHRRWARGELLYDHAGQVAGGLRRRAVAMGLTLEPLSVRAEELRAVHDDTMFLTCGRWFGGSPVVARCGDTVLVGQASSIDSLPPGFTLTAPFVVTRPDIGWLKLLKISMVGRGDVPEVGQICSLRTALGSSMGCGVSGVLYATFHGTKGRAVATPHGPRNPFWTSPSEDVVCYPLLHPLTSLEPCGCSSKSRWVLTRAGTLVHGVAQGENRVQLDCPTPISKLKGASGTPVLCDKGHAVGMMVGASGRSGVGESVRFVVPWSVRPGDVAAAKLPEFPTVPASGYKEVPYFAPTGSGKSTKFPAKLAQDGHTVLVLNPSVVTTKAMHGYMKELTGKAPNVYAGTGKTCMQIKTGSKITYVTYGRFLVNPTGFLQGKAVVICDECHATDGTSVLGMGVVRALAEKAGVKLLVFATATPPGTQLTPHKNITEEVLGGDGDVPFYGLTLKSEGYLRGRHLVFCHSKSECQRVSEELAAKGVHTVTYWRGKDSAVLTADPDLTVVATDAISTGYTGNFATVTDCCSVVREDVDVDLNPTFTVSLNTGPADAALRMQRRGRCGRGAPGTYFQTVKGAPPSGTCGSAATWAAVEAAFMWYGMEDADVTRYLVCYQECPYTSRLPGHPGDVVRVLGVLRPYFHCTEVTQEALRESQWPMLTGIQRHVCLEADAAAPSDDVRWTGINGTGPTPLLYRLGTVTNPQTSHPLTLKMAAALGDTSYHDTTLGPVLLAGAALAAAAAVADATGTLVMAGSWEVNPGGSPVYPDAHSLGTTGDVAGSDPLPEDALREVVTSLDWEWLNYVWGAMASGGAQLVETCRGAAGTAADWWKTSGYTLVRNVPTGSAGARVLCFLEAHLTALLAGTMAVGSAGKSPPFAILASVVCGAASAVPTQVAWMLTLCTSAAAGLVGGPAAGLGVGAGFWLGSKVGGLAVVDMAIGLAAGYEACISTAAIVLDLMDGRATLSNALPCLAGLLCPGAAVGGVALAVILKSAAAGDVTVWMNRLLSMLPKSNTLPDGFFDEKKNVKLGDLVRSLSLVQRIRALCEATKEPEYVYTSATWVGRIIEFAGCVVRMIIDWTTARLPKLAPRIPIASCQKPFRGSWVGVGTALTTCSCGRPVSLTTDCDGEHEIRASRMCSSGWGDPKGFPINTTTTFSGTLRPNLVDAADVTLMVGNGHVIRVGKVGRDWEIRESSIHTLSTALVLQAAARGPIEADGATVSHRIGTITGPRFAAGQRITFNGTLVKLPHILKFKIVYPNMPFVPSLLPEAPTDATESIIGPCERAVEAALQVADEATEVADAVVATATPMLSAAFEARRKAEYEAWLLRERGLGRVKENAGPPDETDEERGERPSLEFASTDDCIYAADPDDPFLDRGATHLMMEDPSVDCEDLPKSLHSEGVGEQFIAPAPDEEVRDVVDAAKNMVGKVGDAMEVSFRGALRSLITGAAAVKKATGAVAAKVAVTVHPVVEELRAEHPPRNVCHNLKEVLVKWYCKGHCESKHMRVDEELTLAGVAADAGALVSHSHEYRVNGVPASPDAYLYAFPGPQISLVAECKVHKVKSVIKTVQHKCCGKDESITRHFGRNIPVTVVKSLFDNGQPAVVLGGDVTYTGDEPLGECAAILEVVHETPCGMSYIWSGRPIQVDEPRAAPVSRPLTAQLRARADRVYVTNPHDVHQRIAKVTIEQRCAEEDRYFRDAYNLALASAGRVLSPGYDYDTAVSKVRPGSARGHVARLSVADLKTDKGKQIVLNCLEGIQTGTVTPHFMLRPKAEVFPQTKGTFKPPRLIVYPSLEFRVAEKMILGDPAVVAKAVMGRSYGFQYAPHERARVLVDMWNSKKQPVAYTVDGTCFDSTVTPEDIRREGEIFARASPEPGLVRLLHDHYATSPMVDPSGNIVGLRRCRASGTLTTSAGNSITCYLKVSAACRKAGLVNPSYLIHGDDVLIVCEKSEADLSAELGAALASYGYDCVPTRHADLTTAESCSASLDCVRTVRGVKHVLRCDMRRGLGRTIGEYGDPVGTAFGYVLNYPTHPVCMYILLPLLLQTSLNTGHGATQLVTIDVRGNSIEIPLHRLGAAVRNLHGRDALAVTGHSATVLQETHDTLQFFGMRGLNHWRRFRRRVKVRLIRAGREWATLARELLWDPGDVVAPVLAPGDYEIPEDLWTHSWEGIKLVPIQHTSYPWLGPTLLGVLALLLLCV